MTEKVEITTLNKEAWSKAWRNIGDVEAAIEFSFMEAQEQAEAEAEKRKLEWAREIIKKSHQERSNKNDQ